jgi:PadR family transcriptional regulator, regulatory protein PadR
VAEPLSILRGTLDTLVLRALLGVPMHGYQISEYLDRRSRGNLLVLDSALYQSLYRLEKQRLVAADWGVTENNREARYYRITTKGRASLRDETASWLRYAATVTAILTEPETAR